MKTWLCCISWKAKRTFQTWRNLNKTESLRTAHSSHHTSRRWVVHHNLTLSVICLVLVCHVKKQLKVRFIYFLWVRPAKVADLVTTNVGLRKIRYELMNIKNIETNVQNCSERLDIWEKISLCLCLSLAYATDSCEMEQT